MREGRQGGGVCRLSSAICGIRTIREHLDLPGSDVKVIDGSIEDLQGRGWLEIYVDASKLAFHHYLEIEGGDGSAYKELHGLPPRPG